MDKLIPFNYIVNQIIIWYNDQGGDFEKNDLSKLKLTKLLFFISAASTMSGKLGLLNIFDNFYAMPYGHVESEIQDRMEQSIYYEISRNKLAFKPNYNGFVNNIEDTLVTEMIDFAIKDLKKINSELVLYDPFKLVELSHEWQSWKTVFSLAKRHGKFSMKIPHEMIISEPKIFKY